MARFRIISLVIALLVAQLSYAGHYHAVDEHHPETECFLCIHASFLDNAVASHYLFFPDAHLSVGSSATGNTAVQVAQTKVFDSRAPPHQK